MAKSSLANIRVRTPLVTDCEQNQTSHGFSVLVSFEPPKKNMNNHHPHYLRGACYLLLPLFCYFNATFNTSFLLVFVFSIILVRVSRSADHLRRGIVFFVLLHVFNALFSMFVLLDFFIVLFLFLFSLLLCLFAAATEYGFEVTRFTVRQSKGQYTLHCIQKYTHNIIFFAEYCSMHMNNYLLLSVRSNCYNIHNLHTSRLFFLLMTMTLHNIFIHIIEFSTHEFHFCCTPSCHVWLLPDVTNRIFTSHDL